MENLKNEKKELEDLSELLSVLSTETRTKLKEGLLIGKILFQNQHAKISNDKKAG